MSTCRGYVAEYRGLPGVRLSFPARNVREARERLRHLTGGKAGWMVAGRDGGAERKKP